MSSYFLPVSEPDAPTLHRRVIVYLLGCTLFSIGGKMFIESRLGTDPLDVLVIGLNLHLGIGMGFCSALVALFFLGWWQLWHRRLPPLMPFITTALVGFMIDFWNYTGVIDADRLGLAPYTLIVTGLLACAYASALIIMSGIGIRIMAKFAQPPKK